jgi:hypothetical protein
MRTEGMIIGQKFKRVAVIVPALLLATFAVFAEDEIEDIGPAVDTSGIESRVTEPPGIDPDDVQPAVDTSASANEITRRSSGNRVMDSIELGRTEITGNQELPKVLYIVPWKKADPGDLTGKPVNTLLDEVLAPIDREEFIRQVGYHNDLYGNGNDEE